MFSEFLADRPVLKDRLLACAVFSGIAVGGVSGFDMIVTGGFDFLTPGREVRQAAPSAFETIVPANWFEQAQAIPMASTEPLFSGDVPSAGEDLDGGSDASAEAEGHYPAVDDSSGDVLYRQLAARYDDRPARTQEVEPAVAVTAPQADETAAQEPDESTARFDVLEDQMQQAIPPSAVPDKPPA